MNAADLAAFRRAYGTPGEAERRTFALARSKMAQTGSGDGRWKIIGHASVFNSPSVEMRSRLGTFTEVIAPGAFAKVLRTNPDVLLLWDHDTLRPLARTSAGTLELSTNAHGLRYYATVTPTSYAADLRNLMADGIISQSSFQFTVAPGGEEWTTLDNEPGTVLRVIREVSNLYDVTVTATGAYPATDAALARTRFLDYAMQRGLLRTDPDAAAQIARAKADIELRRRRLSA